MKRINSIEEFLSLKIDFLVQPYTDTEYGESGFVITTKELPGIKVFGETIEEAIEEFEEAKIAWYEMKEALNEEIQISDGDTKKPSGRLTARFPVLLHQKIIDFAEDNNISINTAINQLINLGFEKVNYDKIIESLSGLKNAVEHNNREFQFIQSEYSHIYSGPPHKRVQRDNPSGIVPFQFTRDNNGIWP